MSELILFQKDSNYINDIVKNGKLTPDEIDKNFIELKDDDVKSISYNSESNILTILLNNDRELSTYIPIDDIKSTDGEIIDFKLVNDNIILNTDNGVYAIDLNNSDVINNLKSKHFVIDGNYDANKGILTLVKDNGDELNIGGFVNYLSDGILSNIYLDNTNLIITMKNGKEYNIDLSSLISCVNIKTISLSDKILRVNKIKTNNDKDLTINDHLIIGKNMTKETKQLTVGENIVVGSNSLAVGVNNEITGSNSLAVGDTNFNENTNNVTLGKENKNSAPNAVIVGRNGITDKLATESFNQGLENKILEGGKASITSGTSNEVNAPSAQAFGRSTKNNGEASMTQGYGTKTSGAFSSAFGKQSEATGEASHAEGVKTLANWKAAHAEGTSTIASGDSAHAEGFETQALETASHAEGQGNITNALASHVGGNYNKIDEYGKYSFVHGSNNYCNAELSFIYGSNNQIDNTCLSNVIILGKNIKAKVNDTLYINKLNINNLEQSLGVKKYLLQIDNEGTVYKLKTTDLIELLNNDFAMITNGEYISYGDNADENKIVLKGDVEEYEVVIDNINDTHIISGKYDPYIKHLYLEENDGNIVDIDFSGHDVPIIEVSIKHDSTLIGDGTSINPLGISPMEKSGQLRPVIDEVTTLPTTNLNVGDRYVSKKTTITGGYLYKFEDIHNVTYADGWRLTTREDWDNLLNALETTEDDKNHNLPGASGWRGNKAGLLLKSKSFGGEDKYEMNILPCNYINNESAVTDNLNTKFWCATQVLNKWDVFSKRFRKDMSQVYNEAISDVCQLSVRLVRDFIEGETLGNTVTINNVEYPIKRMPDNKVWILSNLMDGSIPHTLPDNSMDSVTKNSYAIFEWAGTEWLSKVMEEGECVVIKNKNYDNYILKNGVLVNQHEGFSDLEEKLNQEIQDRIDGDTTLDGKIDAETERAKHAEDTLSVRVDTEIQDRIDGDMALQAALSQEVIDREAADTALDGRIDKEIADRQTADATLDTKITQEVQDRTDADAALQTAINKEVQDRTDADTVLGARIDKEVTDREAADATLDTKIDAETERAKHAEDTLSTRIDTEVQDRIDGDAALSQKIDDAVSGITSDITELTNKLNQEVQDRTDADTALGVRIDTETADREAADTALGVRIDTEIQDRTNADAALDTKIDTEIQDRTDADTALGTRIDTETADRIAGDVVSGVYDNINGKITLTTGGGTIEFSISGDYGTF